MTAELSHRPKKCSTHSILIPDFSVYLAGIKVRLTYSNSSQKELWFIQVPTCLVKVSGFCIAWQAMLQHDLMLGNAKNTEKGLWFKHILRQKRQRPLQAQYGMSYVNISARNWIFLLAHASSKVMNHWYDKKMLQCLQIPKHLHGIASFAISNFILRTCVNRLILTV